MTIKQIILATFMRFRSHGYTFAEARVETFQTVKPEMEWSTFKRKLDIWLAES